MATPIFEDTAILETIRESCQEKKVISLCNKLIKKNSYKSGKDCETLCHLTYWLYIYDKSELALACIQQTHKIAYFTDFGVWTFIHSMWGLEMRILQEQGEESKASEIAHTIDEQCLIKVVAEKMEMENGGELQFFLFKWRNCNKKISGKACNDLF